MRLSNFHLKKMAAITLVMLVVVLWWKYDSKGRTVTGTFTASSLNRSSDESFARDSITFGLPIAAHWGGTVSNAGQPVAGATVCAQATGELILAHAEQVCAKTDLQGRYALRSMQAAAFILTAEAAGFAPESWADGKPLAFDHQTSRDDLNFELDTKGAMLEGTVEDATGGPIAAARVRAFQLLPSRTSVEAYSDEQGRFKLWIRDGTLILSAEADGYASARAQAVAPGRTLLRLVPASTVAGTVRNLDGNPVEGVMVSVMLANEIGIPTGPRAESDENGAFKLEGIVPGRYLLDARGGPYQGGTHVPFDVSIGEHAQDVQVRVGRGAEIRGRVELAESAEPCRQGFMSLGPPDPTRPAQEDAGQALGPLQRTAIRGDGEVVFPGVPRGNYHVTVLCIGHVVEKGPLFLSIDGTDMTDLRWTVRDAGRITVTVTDGANRPLPEHLFLIQMPSSNPAQEAPALAMRTDASGNLTIPGLRQGDYTLLAKPPDEAVPIPVSIRGTETRRATLRLSQSAGIVVTVLDDAAEPASNLQVEASASEAEGATRAAVPRGNGRYEIGPLPGGSYTVSARDGINPPFGLSGHASSVLVTPGNIVALSLRMPPRGAIRGRVLTPEGEPAPNVWVSASISGGGAPALNPQGESRMLTDGLGAFELRGFDHRGQFDVRAEAPEGAVVVARSANTHREVELRLPRTASLRGTAVDADGTPVTQYLLRAFSRETATERSIFVTDQLGEFRLDDLPPGPFTLSAHTQTSRAESGILSVDPGHALTGVVLQFGRFGH